jgi:hypothetical protein
MGLQRSILVDRGERGRKDFRRNIGLYSKRNGAEMNMEAPIQFHQDDLVYILHITFRGDSFRLTLKPKHTK